MSTTKRKRPLSQFERVHHAARKSVAELPKVSAAASIAAVNQALESAHHRGFEEGRIEGRETERMMRHKQFLTGMQVARQADQAAPESRGVEAMQAIEDLNNAKAGYFPGYHNPERVSGSVASGSLAGRPFPMAEEARRAGPIKTTAQLTVEEAIDRFTPSMDRLYAIVATFTDKLAPILPSDFNGPATATPGYPDAPPNSPLYVSRLYNLRNNLNGQLDLLERLRDSLQLR